MFFKPGYGFPQLAEVVQELSCGKFSREINRSGDKMMSLKLISGMMKSSGDEALLAMDAGGANQMVVIDRAALLEVAEPRRCDENRLQENIELFSRPRSMIAATSNRMVASELARTISFHGGKVRMSKASRQVSAEMVHALRRPEGGPTDQRHRYSAGRHL